MPSNKKSNKLKSVKDENLEEFADRVDNVDYVIGRNDLTNTSFFKFISEVLLLVMFPFIFYIFIASIEYHCHVFSVKNVFLSHRT